MRFIVSTDQILWLCTFITGLWGIYKIIKEAKKPNDELKAKVEMHDQVLNDNNKRLKEMDESNKMIMKSLSAIINHEITGNNVDKMKDIRDELQEYLIER